MRHQIFGLAIVACCLILACKSDKKDAEAVVNETTEITNETSTNNERRNTEVKEKPAHYDDNKKALLSFESKGESNVTGNVVFTQELGVVTMIGIVDGLTSGEYSIHVVNADSCDSQNVTLLDKNQYFSDDIGTLTANSDGHGNVTKITENWCLGCEDASKDISGKLLVVQQGNNIMACGQIKL